jgi:hypothetical protein
VTFESFRNMSLALCVQGQKKTLMGRGILSRNHFGIFNTKMLIWNEFNGVFEP